MAAKTSQGRQTRQAILEVAARIASVEGLQGLTLGRLAQELEMSKSGLFAHFGSKQELQLATIEHVRQIYVDRVVIPGQARGRGLAALHGLCDEYLALMERRVFPGGCFFAAAMAEFDARPGPVRDRIAVVQRAWLDALEGAAARAVERGELKAGLAPDQLAFELEAVMLSANWYFHLYSDRDFFRRARQAVERVLDEQATAAGRRLLASGAAQE